MRTHSYRETAQLGRRCAVLIPVLLGVGLGGVARGQVVRGTRNSDLTNKKGD